MTELERELLLLVRAHAPAATSAGSPFDTLEVSSDLRSDLGFDLIALAELAVAVEDAFGVEVKMPDLDGCRTVADLRALVAARIV
jgi:acyl carrier protein